LHHNREGAGRTQDQREPGGRDAAGGGAWDGAIWLAGPDDRKRRIGPGLQLLADGPAPRSGRLRVYGIGLDFEKFCDQDHRLCSAERNVWRELADCTMTIFEDRVEKGPYRQCVASSDCDTRYPPDLFPDQLSAKVAVWGQKISPTRRRRP
jgi:hypothetical protein